MAYTRKRKFFGNQHTSAKQPKVEDSRSASKLKDASYDVGSQAPSGLEGYRLIDVGLLAEFVSSNLVCKRCYGRVEITEAERQRMGLSSKLVVTCTKCKHKEESYTSRTSQHGAMDVNRRMVMGMRMIGCGLEPLQQFCGIMNMAGSMTPGTYRRHVTALLKAAEEEAQKSMRKAVDDTRHFYAANPDGTVDMGVSGDGSWRKKGFMSFHGVGTAISIMTGKVVDVSIKSSYCRGCTLWDKKKGTPEYDMWLSKHPADCHKNYSGSSGGMEVSSLVDMFKRSVATRQARYVDYLGDGDSKAIKGINDAKPYGPDLEVQKLECINHVSKRMYARLDSLKNAQKGKVLSDGKGMNGRGRLTANVMKELQRYYGRAIRENQGSIQDMKKAIWATYYHRISTDQQPQHHHCPVGLDTWCKYNLDTSTYEHHDSIPMPIADLIYSAYEELSRDTLLEKCTHGGTSNPNESFNNVLWRIAPKTDFAGLPSVELSAYLAVISFNDGAGAVLRVLSSQGVGSHAMAAAKKKDKQRTKISRYQDRPEVKKRRYVLKRLRRQKQDKEVQREGVTYGAGQF